MLRIFLLIAAVICGFDAANAQAEPAAPRTLFPVGKFESLPKLPSDLQNAVRLPRAVPPDVAERRARFQARKDDAALAELAQRLQKVLIPGTPGLESFESLCAQQKWPAALAAYRAYFFAKLKQPEAFGAHTENILFELTRDRGKAHMLKAPNPEIVALNMQGATAAKRQDGSVLVAVLGAPGAVWWAPADLAPPEDIGWGRDIHSEPFWRSEVGRQWNARIDFYRGLRTLPSDSAEWQSGFGFFPHLLFDYTVHHRRASLDRWCEYFDDYALHGRQDQIQCRLDIRGATELETQQARAMLTLLRVMLDERPTLAEEFDAATLARLVMMLVEDYPPYVIRARRAEQANWGIMGICHLLHLANFLHEFQAMEYYNREAWRLWAANMIQHRTLDGENIESWDTGHNAIDVDYANMSLPFARPAAGFDRHALAALDDHLRVNERSFLVHLTPTGDYWPSWGFPPDPMRNDVRRRYQHESAGRTWLDRVKDEPHARQRIAVATGDARAAAEPPHLPNSDLAPYGAMAYLRESWRPDAAMLILQNFNQRSQDLAGSPKTGYAFAQAGRYLIEVNSLAVDGRPDNRNFGQPRTGGKTEFSAQAARQVEPMRFLTSDRFDYADAWQDKPYAVPDKSMRFDLFGLYRNDVGGKDAAPITNVKTLRQVFHVRGENLWLVADRVEAPADATHEYTQFMALPVLLPEKNFAQRVAELAKSGNPLVERDPAGGWVRTTHPDLANVAAWCFAPQPLQVANRIDWRTRKAVADQRTPVEAIQAALQAGRTWKQIMKASVRNGDEQCFIYPSSVRWTGTGPQAFVTALLPQPPFASAPGQAEKGSPAVESFGGKDGIVGCRTTTAGGAKVWLQVGPHRRNTLTAGPVRAQAESLLVVEKNGQLSGLVLGGESFILNGRETSPRGDFQFAALPDGELQITPIHQPTDTVRIAPAVNVFTDSIEVAFDIPHQDMADIELRYTLDGSEPTFNSKLYTGPFTLTETTRVKVRPLRKGLAEAPWSIPGALAGKTVWATFHKQPLRPAITTNAPSGEFRYEYFEGDWLKLFTHAGADGVLSPKKSGVTRKLLDSRELAALRQTDRAYAVRYTGSFDAPESGVYSFPAPPHFLTTTMDAGYDLRVWVDGEEWLPNPDLHCENIWCIPLAKGRHALKVVYVDYRWKTFRNEYWMSWRPEQMFHGVPHLLMKVPYPQ